MDKIHAYSLIKIVCKQGVREIPQLDREYLQNFTVVAEQWDTHQTDHMPVKYAKCASIFRS